MTSAAHLAGRSAYLIRAVLELRLIMMAMITRLQGRKSPSARSSCQKKARMTTPNTEVVPAGGSGPGPSQSGSSSVPVDISNIPVQWEGKHAHRTDLLISWLRNNFHERTLLFSDSTADAKAAGRKKIVGRESKNVVYVKIVHAVFSNDQDPVFRENYCHHIPKFTRAVENRLGG